MNSFVCITYHVCNCFTVKVFVSSFEVEKSDTNPVSRLSLKYLGVMTLGSRDVIGHVNVRSTVSGFL